MLGVGDWRQTPPHFSWLAQEILGLLEAAASRLAARGKGLRVWLELALNSFQDALVSASILFIIMLGNARVMSVCC